MGLIQLTSVNPIKEVPNVWPQGNSWLMMQKMYNDIVALNNAVGGGGGANIAFKVTIPGPSVKELFSTPYLIIDAPSQNKVARVNTDSLVFIRSSGEAYDFGGNIVLTYDGDVTKLVAYCNINTKLNSGSAPAFYYEVDGNNIFFTTGVMKSLRITIDMPGAPVTQVVYNSAPYTSTSFGDLAAQIQADTLNNNGLIAVSVGLDIKITAPISYGTSANAWTVTFAENGAWGGGSSVQNPGPYNLSGGLDPQPDLMFTSCTGAAQGGADIVADRAVYLQNDTSDATVGTGDLFIAGTYQEIDIN
jgi:hypothetical protein